MCLSCSIMPSSAFMTSKHTSLLSIAFIERSTEYFSIFSYIFPFFLIPAVSIATYFFLLYVNSVSIASLVVPAIGDTITFSSLISAFTRLLLPTFGLPIKQNFILSSVSSSSMITGKSFTSVSSKSDSPIECSPLTPSTYSKPSS